jgi:maltose-binding protein MalE
MMDRPRVTRRAVLRTSLGAAATALAACVQPPPPPTQAPKPAATPAQPAQPAAEAPKTGQGVTLRVLTQEFFMDTMYMPASTLYNAENQGKVFVRVETAPDGWETKIIQMVKEKNILWNGYGYDSYFSVYQRAKAGVLMPLDDLVKSSSVPWARTFGSTFFIPQVADAHKFEGKIWQIPAKIDVVYSLFNVKMLQEVGYAAFPETWDEVRVMLRKVKEKFGPDDVIPMAVNLDSWRAFGGIYCTFTGKPYNEDGHMDVQSKEYGMALELMKSFYDDKLANPALLNSPDEMGTWQKGKMAVQFNSTSWLVAAHTAWGKPAYAATNLPRPNKGDPPRTKTYIAGSAVFQHAANPQETLDFLLTVHGPEGPVAEAFMKGQINRSGAPFHKTWIEHPVVKENKDHPHLYPGYKMIENSTPAPVSPLHLVLDAAQKKLVPPYFKGEASLAETVKKIHDQVQADKSKLIQGTY